jgi:hypothetical protein
MSLLTLNNEHMLTSQRGARDKEVIRRYVQRYSVRAGGGGGGEDGTVCL